MPYPKNYEEFTRNVSKPTIINIDDYDYILYKFKFNGLQDFYDFLKADPKINTEIWDELSSLTSSASFAGAPYKKAIEKLIEDTDPGYQEYLKIQKQMQAREKQVHKYNEIKSIAGGVINPVDYTTGSATIYRTSRLINQPKFVTIDTQVAYNWMTNKSQVFNRALIITNLIRALERKNYKIDLNSFMMAREGREIICAIFELKKHNQPINYQALYKSLVDVEFFRRLCFRIMEVSDVTDCDWPSGYGSTCDKDFVRKLLRLKKEDIYFDQPNRMGIQGDEIGYDFENAIKRLHLENIIDIEKEKDILRNSVKVLKK